MRFIFSSILCLTLTVFAAAQSGRNKTPAENQPTRPQRPSVELPSSQMPVKTAPSPTPAKSSEVEDDEVVRVESILIPIPVSITDARGAVVSNLQLKDFELRVDGEAKEISDVSRSESPVRLALLFDNSSSVIAAREFEKRAAAKFLKRVLRPNIDQAALYAFSTGVSLEQKLTHDVRRLVDSIELFPAPSGATALFDAIVDASNYLGEAATGGRKVIVIVSDGVDTISDQTLEQTVRAAQLANCQIYVVKTTDFENFKRTGDRGSSANLRDLTAERRMQEITGQTGGTVYSPLDDRELEQAFAQIAAELSEQYILSYYPTETKASGKFHQIALRVSSRQNLTVRTRKGYYVPKPSL